MSTSESDPPVSAQRRQKVLVGALPGDFLRINVSPKQQQEAADYEAALALYYQTPSNSVSPNLIGRLNITVVQAKLTKNYGMTRMDPYVRLRVGHCVYETHTDPSGGKNPHWNKVVQCLLPKGVNSIYVEIYDECSFTIDELIASAHITIASSVMGGNTVEDWYPLSGKQGIAKEGMINLVLSYTSGVNPYLYGNAPPVMMVPSTAQNMFGMPQYAPVSVYTQPPVPPQPVLNAQVLTQIEEMFPNIDKSIVKMVYEANGGNKDAAVNSLLEMSE